MPSNPEVRALRRKAILQLLREKKPIRSQADLVRKLREQSVQATQPSISRDLRELGVHRSNGRYVLEPGVSEEWDLGRFTDFVEAFKTAGPYQTLVRTRSGTARIVAMAIDLLHWPEVVGTIAGENTVLVCTENGDDQKGLLLRLARFLRRGPVDTSEP